MKNNKLRNSFAYAFKRTIPVLVGYLPLGLCFGVLMADAGYAPYWSTIFGLTVYSGALEIIGVEFLKALTPLLTVTITAVLLNSRHIFYGLSFIEKFRSYGAWKYLLIFSLTDENYSLICSYKPKDGVEEKWVHIFSSSLTWLYWVSFSTLGGIIGQAIEFNTKGIDFALTALFIVILADQLREAKSNIPPAIALFSSMIWLVLVGGDNFLLPSMLTTVAAFVLMKKPIQKKTEGK